MNDQQLEYLAKRLESLLETTLGQIRQGGLPSGEVAQAWLKEIGANLKGDPEGNEYAPDQYTLSLHPADYEALTQFSQLAQSNLSTGLRLVLQESGYLIQREPHITLATDPTLSQGEVRVIAWHSRDPIQPPGAPTEDEEIKETPPEGAFFIIEGRKHFPLKRPVVNIGRRLDNHLVLDDPHVSRQHAQLRAKKGRFHIYDLDSTSGTRVNGQLVNEAPLQPGDVVSLATVTLIYGEDPGGPPELTPRYTPPFRPEAQTDQITPLDLNTIEEPIDKSRLDLEEDEASEG